MIDVVRSLGGCFLALVADVWAKGLAGSRVLGMLIEKCLLEEVFVVSLPAPPEAFLAEV
jgi:hypothetical protein